MKPKCSSSCSKQGKHMSLQAPNAVQVQWRYLILITPQEAIHATNDMRALPIKRATGTPQAKRRHRQAIQ